MVSSAMNGVNRAAELAASLVGKEIKFLVLGKEWRGQIKKTRIDDRTGGMVVEFSLPGREGLLQITISRETCLLDDAIGGLTFRSPLSCVVTIS